MGAIPAGSPLSIEEEAENYITLPEEWTKGEEVFLLRVRGKSMSPFILPGDQVIVRRQQAIPEGAIGVFRMDNEVTLKRFYQKKDQIILKGDNPDIAPLIIKKQDLASFAILGKVIGIYRPLNS
jgi:repressor LexA